MEKKPHNKTNTKSNKSGAKSKSKSAKKVSTILVSILIVFLLTCAIVGICIITYIISFANGDIAINLDSYKDNQNQTSIVYAYDDNNKSVEIARLHGEENRIWVDLDKIPKNLQNAFIALEDKRFRKHNGVDWLRTMSVVFKYHFQQGGSTITQQLIKNLTGDNEVTFSRKFNEILYALNLENNYSKDEILEAYLNTIPLGSGCYGVQTAAKTYFGKDVSTLNLAECASIVSITNATTYFNPLLNPENNKDRQELCLKFMYQQDYISKKEYNDAKKYHLIFTNSSDYVASDEAQKADKDEDKVQSYFVDFVVDSVISDLMEQYGYTKSEASRMVYYGGLKIYSTENQSVQDAMEYVYENRVTFPAESTRTETGANGTKKKVQSAMTVLDYSGRVVGIVGGAGKKTENRNLNRAADSPRQPGSSIKPLSVYSPALEKGIINWSTEINNSPIIVDGKKWPKNYGGSYGDGSNVTVQYAIQESLNTVSARVTQDLKPKTCADFLMKKYNVSTVTDSDYAYSPMAVGGMRKGITTLEMAAAYATFGNNGKYYAPYCYYKVTNADGSKVYLENKSVAKQSISPETANIMNKLLQMVVARGTAAGYGVNGFTTYMKTGTTTDNFDRWVAGGTPYYAAAVWYGYDKNEKITNVSGNPSGKIFKEVMNKIHSNMAAKDFEMSGLIVERQYCTKTGLLASDSCTSTATGWYKASDLPKTCTSCSAGTTEGSTDVSSAVAATAAATTASAVITAAANTGN